MSPVWGDQDSPGADPDLKELTLKKGGSDRVLFTMSEIQSKKGQLGASAKET